MTATATSPATLRPARAATSWFKLLPRVEVVWVGVLLGVVAAAHAINMFDYPFYENDEGAYMSQAWALVHMGELAPYTYWYDHAPFGWIQIAVWTLLTGGFYTFGTSVESGRVLMLLYQLGSAALVYVIARRVTGSVIAATVAVLIFGLSVYGLYFHRRVLLDNIATFWALASVAMLAGRGRLSLWRIWMSALCLALGVLSKEVVVFLVPGLAGLAWYRSAPPQRLLALSGWLVVSGAVISLYVLMALLKGELFPTGTWLGGTSEHVSLLGSVSYQASRGSRNNGIFDLDGAFWTWARDWARIDPLLVIGGTAAAFLNIVQIKSRPVGALLGVMALGLWGFLARGGIVIEFYLVPLLPFLALSIAVAVHQVFAAAARVLSGPRRQLAVWVVRPAAMGLVLAGLLWGYTLNSALGVSGTPFVMWSSPQATAQRDSIEWARHWIGASDAIVIDAYTWTDLHDPPEDTREFDLAHWYWKVDLDPEIRDDVFAGAWENLDYVMETPQMRRDLDRETSLALTRSALEHSTPIAAWDADGWEVSVRRVDKVRSVAASSNSILAGFWNRYKDKFIDAGRVTDPSTGTTTSEGQSYALLQAVYMNDRDEFEQVWGWTQQNLQQRSGLFAWQYGAREDGSTGVLDRGPATDADTDIALALLLASKRWDVAEYQDLALVVANAIWDDLTVVVDGVRYLAAGEWAREAKQPVVNPSYLAPYAYRIFADADPEHPWLNLVDSTYVVFEKLRGSDALGGAIGAVPNWISIRPDGGLDAAAEMGDYGTRFSFDASRVPWRLAVDWLWFGDERAKQALDAFDLPANELQRTGRLAAEYNFDGSVFADYESISMYAGVTPALLLGGAEEQAYDVLAEHVIAPLVTRDDAGYYDSNWAWFSTALVDGGFSNLWAGLDRVVWVDPLRAAPGDRAGGDSIQRP